MIVVDSHEDLAWNILSFQRDYTRAVAETRDLEVGSKTPERNGNTMLGWPEWIKGRVAIVFASLFAAPVRYEKDKWDIRRYSNAEEAHRLYSQQLDVYGKLVDDHPDKFRLVRDRADLAEVVDQWERFERVGTEPESDPDAPARSQDGSFADGRGQPPAIGLVLLMEGSDGIRSPDEVAAWQERGVRIVGPSWIGTRYAGGTQEPGGFTVEGRALLELMAELGMVLDLSHLAEVAAHEALDRYPGPLIASHSNPRALVPNDENPDRHLSDEVIRGISEREGVIGIVPYNKFLSQDWVPGEELTLEEVVAHIDYVCQLLGHANAVGIGSDFDGGFGRESVPVELDSIADLGLIGETLRMNNYSSSEVEAILGRNWLGVLDRALPNPI